MQAEQATGQLCSAISIQVTVTHASVLCKLTHVRVHTHKPACMVFMEQPSPGERAAWQMGCALQPLKTAPAQQALGQAACRNWVDTSTSTQRMLPTGSQSDYHSNVTQLLPIQMKGAQWPVAECEGKLGSCPCNTIILVTSITQEKYPHSQLEGGEV